MSKDTKSIFKMQNAGSIPEVNQYGLTDEQMQSVRDNMRRYKISEEEAVSNKIKAMNESNNWGRELYRSLGGMYKVTADKLDSQLTPMQKEAHAFEVNRMVNDFHNTANNFYRSVKYDPNWKIKAKQEVDKLKWDFANTARASRDYAHMIVGYKGPFSSYSPDALRIAENIKRGNYRNNKDYEKYVQEYLDQNPRKYNFFADNYHTMSPNSDATTNRTQAAHDYAVSKLKERWDRDKELANSSNYNYQRHLENAYHPDYEKYNPRNQWIDSLKKSTAVGGSAMLTLSMLPWLGSEVATYGLLGAIPRIAGGYIGSELGVKGAGFVGKQADKVLGTKWIEPTAKFAGLLAGWRKGEGLAYNGALKGTNLAMKTVANNMIRNGAHKVTFEPKQWLLGKQMQADLKLSSMGVKPINLEKLYNLSGAYKKTNPSVLIPAPAYKKGGIFKNQMGGLVYKPYIPEQNGSKQTSSPTLSYEPEESDNESFQVEPVRIYTQTTQNTVPEEHRVIEPPVQEQEIPIQEQEQETPVQVDNTRVQKPVQEYKGKIYKSSEKEQFKEDLYNTYFKALIQRELDEVKASEFAKRLATQDILESNWGQSSLSKDFNFGGVKDFSGKGINKDTTEFINGKEVKVKQPFRKFANIDEYINYKINLVDKKWNIFASDPDKYYSLIVSGKQKYATDPNYVTKLNKLYKQIWT